MKLHYVKNAPIGERWQGTQADAKGLARRHDRNLVTRGAGNWAPRDVPTDKEGLLQFLNALELQLAGGLPATPAAAAVRQAEDPVPAAPAIDRGGNCPKCKFDRRSAERVAQHLARSATDDAREAWIAEEADASALGRLAGAIAHRFTTLAKADRS